MIGLLLPTLGVLLLLGVLFDVFDDNDDSDSDSDSSGGGSEGGETETGGESLTGGETETGGESLTGGETETGGESLTGGETETGDTDDDEEEDEDDGVIVVRGGDTVGGGPANDVFALELPEDGSAPDPVSVDGNRGNDNIDLSDDSLITEDDPLPSLLTNSTIDGGLGNDRIDAQMEDSTVFANKGNDTVTGTYIDSFVDGWIGNDVLTVDGSGSTVLGYDGADTITDNMEGGIADGEAGNDVMITDAGDAVATEVRGGPGNDTFRIDATPIVDRDAAGFDVTGGQGADVFEVTTNEASGNPFEWTGEQVSNVPVAPGSGPPLFLGTPTVNTGVITDFTPGEDVLVIDGTPVGPDFTLTEVTLQEFADGPPSGPPLLSTEVRLTYESDLAGALVRDVVFVLTGASGVTAADIQLIGADSSVISLEAAAAA
jgi:Ca2+-binding RTX toxin-like protein